ncbi:hypothetical protein Mpsy_0623 [Methanolobus psychrophilus R15]|nr:hypothetical protein Mpsy_0623 [Methanolobus psychrophilus R15]
MYVIKYALGYCTGYIERGVGILIIPDKKSETYAYRILLFLLYIVIFVWLNILYSM